MLLCLAMLAAVIPALNTKAAAASDSKWGTGSVTAAMEVADQTYALTCTSHSFTSVTYGTTCQTYAHTCYTCTKCGYSYNTFPADASMSDWQTERPTVDASMVETGTQYRYRNYETVTSYETDLEDYELVGSQWVKYDTTAVNYVTQWPSGFDTDNSLYNKYANQRQKVSNYTADLTKLEVNSDAVVGYLYYHWCYSGHPYTSATNTGSYNRFHAYYSTATPSSANASDPSDDSYRFDSSTACSDSKWYFVVPVYAQTYTTYKNQFTYRCWGEPSQWSTTPVTETDSRQVETRTVYRYVTAELPEHNYVNNVCTVCGQSRLSANYYLFGYINGADYACEADYLNMGAYKFVDGKLAARFEQDSYVGVKSEGNADWYMTAGWQGSATTVILYNTNELTNSDKLLVPGGVDLVFTLADNGNGTLTLSYTQATGECKHNYTGVITKPTCTNSGYTTYTCTLCGYSYIGDRTDAVDHSYSTTIVPNTCTEAGYTLYSCGACGYSYTSDYTNAGHSYEDGYCTGCGEKDPSYVATYYLVGYINGADYGCDSDYLNMGAYKFVNGKLSVTFTQDSYVFLKTGDNAKWLLAASYCTDTVCTFKEGNSERMYVPGNVQLTFTLAENGDGSVTLSYVKANTGCKHTYDSGVITTNPTCTTAGVKTFTCTQCGESYTENVSATGHSLNATVVEPTCDEDGYTIYSCSACSYHYTGSPVAATGHSYKSGVCSACGRSETVTPENTYYLVGYINGADYGCEGDYENLGQYQFVNGKLTATFTQDSYVFLKTGDNAKWLLAFAYCTDTTCTFKEGNSEKMFVPGNVELSFTLTQNSDGSVTLSYREADACKHSYSSAITKQPTCTAAGVKTFTCSLCADSYTEIISAKGHSYASGVCSTCGAADPNYGGTTANTYYLVGWINGADYGCESDWENMGQYKFVNGHLTATFDQDSYVFLKTEGNGKWLLSDAYCTDSTCTFREGSSEKMFIPGNVQLNFTLAENADGSVTMSYTTSSTEPSAVPTLTLKAPTLEFKDMITVNAFYTAENIEDVVEMGMITYSTKVYDWSVATAEHVIPGATYDASTGRYFSSSQGIHAKYLGDSVYLAIYAKLEDGTYAYSKLASYSAVQYATNQLKNSTDTKLKQLVAAMLNYGAEAQLYFGHNIDTLANISMTAAQKALPATYSSSMVSAVPSVPAEKQGSFANNQGFASKKPAISFEGAFCINYFFTPNYAPESGITLYYWNAEDYSAASVLTTANATGFIKLAGSGTGEYRGDIAGISAKAISEAVYVAAVYKSSGTVWTSGVLGYSIGAYCSSQASKGGDIAGLAMATAVYGYHAKQYFG